MDFHFIAKTMCDLTLEELWEPRREWALQRRPDGELLLRVGSGKATYVSHARTKRGPLTLTYGVKMIASKTKPGQMSLWRTGKEIKERGYFGGELTLLNVLAHTIIHEFGHVIQVLMDVRNPGSSHSPEFYKILDKAHRNGHADRIRHRLHTACLARGIDLSTIIHTESAGQCRVAGSGLSLTDITKGDKLYVRDERFQHHNPLVVIRKNRKTIIERHQDDA